MKNKKEVLEKEITSRKGQAMTMMVVVILGFLASTGLMIGSFYEFAVTAAPMPGAPMLIVSCVGLIGFFILCFGFHILNPNEAMVLTLFGEYYGTIKEAGFYYVNPFESAIRSQKAQEQGSMATNSNTNQTGQQVVATPPAKKKISTKTMTLNNQKQKVNDVLGNPIIIGSIVIWKVVNPTKAVFNVEDYETFLSIQCDSTIRNITRLYPYDTMEDDSDEKTLRGSSKEIADSMKEELQKKVEVAGLEIQEVRITHLSYAEEIAAAMLQRQQAVAVIAARQKIVEGAVSMVEMAINQLSEEEIVVLDEERKAAMVSNLLVVLCGNKEAQPIVNSGSIY